MKFINLRAPAYVNGELRQPNEGALQVTEKEAARLIGEELADDVTDDFAAAEQEAPSAKEPTPSPTDGSTTSADRKATPRSSKGDNA